MQGASWLKTEGRASCNEALECDSAMKLANILLPGLLKRLAKLFLENQYCFKGLMELIKPAVTCPRI